MPWGVYKMLSCLSWSKHALYCLNKAWIWLERALFAAQPYGFGGKIFSVPFFMHSLKMGLKRDTGKIEASAGSFCALRVSRLGSSLLQELGWPWRGQLCKMHLSKAWPRWEALTGSRAALADHLPLALQNGFPLPPKDTACVHKWTISSR